MKKLKIKVKAEELRKKLGIKDGKDGYTPVKNKDYFDGAKGDRGEAGKDGANPSIQEVVDKSVEQIKPLIPKIEEIEDKLPMLSEQIRDALELLTGDDRLDKSAIRGLEDFIGEKVKFIGGGSTARNFYQLMDVPQSYVGEGGKALRVNSGATGLEFYTPVTGIAIGDIITSATQGSVFFTGPAGVLAQDNANLFWDDTNNRLGIGTNSPGAALQVNGAVSGIASIFKANATTPGNLTEWQNSSGTVLANVTSAGVLNLGQGATFAHTAGITGASSGGVFTILMPSGGTVGIGHSYANYALQVWTGSGSESVVIGAGINNGTASDASLEVRARVAAGKGLIVKGASSQSANLQEWQTNAGTPYMWFDVANAHLGFINTASLGSTGGFNVKAGAGAILKLHAGVAVGVYDDGGNNVGSYLYPANAAQTTALFLPNATTRGIVIQGAASQSANLQEWQNSSGTVLGYVSAAGNGFFKGKLIAGDGAVGTSYDLEVSRTGANFSGIVFGSGYSTFRVVGANDAAVVIGRTGNTADKRYYAWSVTSGDKIKLALSNDIETAITTDNIIVADSTGKVGIGIASPTTSLHIASTTNPGFLLTGGAAGYADAYFRYGESSVENASAFVMQKARTSVASPSAVQNNDRLGIFIAQGYDGNSYETAAAIRFYADGTVGDGDMPGRIEMKTTLDGGVTEYTHLTIKNTGLVGIGQGNTSPSARLHVAEATIGNEVFRIESTATNDDPAESVFQNRVATTNATTTTIHTFAIPASTSYAIEATVVARRTGGTAGTTDDGGFFRILAVYNNLAGTATIIGTEMENYSQSNTGTWLFALTPSGSNVLAEVTGDLNTNVTWHMTAKVWKVNS